jgi:hypothetical protein
VTAPKTGGPGVGYAGWHRLRAEQPAAGALALTPKQAEFMSLIQSGEYNYLLYGGAIRGGKSIGGIAALFVLARVFPGSRWIIVRRDLPTLRRNTIPTFERIKPDNFVGEMHHATWTVRCANGSEFVFLPENWKQDKDLDRWKGLECNGFLLEEANELQEAAFKKAIERAGSWRCRGAQPPPLVLLTCNPAKNWVKRMFYDPWKMGKLKAPWHYLPATIEDNPHVDPGYLASLENLKTADERAYNRFVKGDWEGVDDPEQLIKFEWVIAAQHDVEHVPGKKSLGVDVARFGNDDTCLGVLDGNEVLALDYHHGIPIDRTADIVQATMNAQTIDADRVKIDTVGLGAGVADILVRKKFRVREFVAGAKPLERRHKENEDGALLDGPRSFYRFKDIRSQAWWEFRERLRNHELVLPQDPRLTEDLTAPRYYVDGEKVLKVESKDEIRERIGRSTDAGDTAVMAAFDMSDNLSMDLQLPDAIKNLDFRF